MSSNSWEPTSESLNAAAAVSPEWPHGAVQVRSVARIGADYGLSGGCVYRVLANAGSGGSVSFVVKRESAKAVAGALRFHREVGVQAAGSVPALLGGHVDPAGGIGVLMLEDVAPAEQGDVLAGCTDRQALAAVRSLARVHAASYPSARDDCAPNPVPRWAGSAMAVDIWAMRLSTAAAHFPEFLTPPLVDRLRGFPRTVERAIELLRRGPACWIHGDAHLDNVLFRPGGTAVLLDWSGAVFGPAAVDLARLLTEGVNAGARPELVADLITAYTDQLGVGGVRAAFVDPWEGLANGLALLVQAAIGWAARDETREPRARMQRLQENLLRSVCAWMSTERATGPHRIFP